MKRFLTYLAICCLLASSCDRKNPEQPDNTYESVLVYYVVGHNNLNSSIKRNLQTLKDGSLPYKKDKKAVVVFDNFLPASNDYSEGTTYIVRLYKEQLKKDQTPHTVCDTLKAYPMTLRSTNPDDMKTVLTDIMEKFPSKSYSMILSSHGTGWLPNKYYNDHFYDDQEIWSTSASTEPQASAQQTSFGADTYINANNRKESNEMDIIDLARSIPFHCEFILFDACFMGSVEVAYELKDVTDKLAVSPAEVMSDGFDYSKVYDRLVKPSPAAIEDFAKDFYEFYQAQTGVFQSATISVVDCRELDTLKDICSQLFDKYRLRISLLNYKKVQQYYRQSDHWFFDLKDMLVKAGITATEEAQLQAALDNCILYEGHTAALFVNQVYLNNCCGLSSYIPTAGTTELNDYYKKLSWNIDTKFLK